MKNKQAFTLIELMVVIALFAFLVIIAMPSFIQFQQASRLKTSAQKVETTFGEAFSSARSRPECFKIEVNDDNLNKFSFINAELNDLKKCDFDGETVKSREISLNPGVNFTKSFTVVYRPPFGDLEITNGDGEEVNDLLITIENEEDVSFKIFAKSGLFTRWQEENLENLNPPADEE